MTFAELRAELKARGFDFLDDARAGRMVNQARAELDGAYPWPYREASSSGPPPLTINDLGRVDSVTDTTQALPLERATSAEILEFNGDLATAGSPCVWYHAGSQIAVFPVSSGPIMVRYWKVPPDLSADGDTPLAPARFHGLIVDMAVRRAYQATDNLSAAEGLEAQIARDLARMVNDLMGDYGQTHVAPVGVDC